MRFPGIAVLSKAQPLKAHSLDAIDRCLRNAGYAVRHTYDESAPEPILFTWSWGKAQIARIKNPGAIICTLDHGYTRDRAGYINTGWSTPDVPTGLNGFAEHVWSDDPSRAEAQGLGLEIRPPRESRLKRALLLGQVYGDAMIRGQVDDYKSWLRSVSEGLGRDGYSVTFRPHPVMVRRGDADKYGNLGRRSVYADLWDDLREHEVAVALNSNGLVAALLDGLRVRWYNQGTMLSPLGEMGDEERFRARAEWVRRIAWTQWTVKELEDGTWLRYHAPIMERLAFGGKLEPWCDRRIT